ncbi:MAG: SpoIIE family protein phosphatase [Turneriella sp.]
MSASTGKKNTKTSIVTQLSLLFLTLAVVNLIVTWVFSGANQMRLISEKANLSGSTVAFEIIRRVSPLFAPGQLKRQKPDIAHIVPRLQVSAADARMLVPAFALVSNEFEVLGNYPENAQFQLTAEISQNILKAVQLRDLSGQAYFVRPDLKDYSIELYIPLTNTGARDLVFISRVRVDSIADDLKSLVRLVVATIILMLVIQVAIGFLIYRILIKPIRDVSAAAVALGGGEFATVALPKRQRDEILLLVESFNEMSQELKQKDATIRNQIDELQEKNDVLDFELEIAERIQQSIMPDADRLNEINASLEYVPLNRVSGDYYDFVRLANGSVALIIADASGHGVPAAFLTILMKVFFSDLVHQHHDAGQLIREINRQISRYLESTGFYLTAFVVLVEPSGRAQYCNCGHPSPLKLSATGDIAELGGESDVIGLTAESDNYSATEIQFNPGDKLILFTDGLTELRNAEGEFLPAAEMHDLLRQKSRLSALEIRTAITQLARGFQQNAKASDDFTLAVVSIDDLFLHERHATPEALPAQGESREAVVARLLRQIIHINDAPSYHALLANVYLRLGEADLARATVQNALSRFATSEALARLSRKVGLVK